METTVLAVVPHEPVSSKLRLLMERYSSLLHSYGALKLPPHFTIVPRFKTKKYTRLIDALTKECKSMNPITVELESLKFFKSPPVLFFNIKLTKEIQQIHERLLDVVEDYKEPGLREELKEYAQSHEQQKLLQRYGSPFVKQFYHPHLTLAGSDVLLSAFKKLCASLPHEKSVTLEIKSIHVLRKKDGTWAVDKEISLGKR